MPTLQPPHGLMDTVSSDALRLLLMCYLEAPRFYADILATV